MAEEIKRLSTDVRAFEANGKKYIVHDLLTFDAFTRLEELEVEILSGNSPRQMVSLLEKAYGDLNQHKFADASVKIYNALNIGERVKGGIPPAWMLTLTLFIRPEGSDLSGWKQADALQWIEDWNAEGYAASDLFTLACECRKRLDTVFAHSSPDTSSGSSESAPVGEPKEKSLKG